MFAKIYLNHLEENDKCESICCANSVLITTPINRMIWCMYCNRAISFKSDTNTLSRVYLKRIDAIIISKSEKLPKLTNEILLNGNRYRMTNETVEIRLVEILFTIKNLGLPQKVLVFYRLDWILRYPVGKHYFQSYSPIFPNPNDPIKNNGFCLIYSKLE